jgi:uncharacterized membrane protein YbhN (UPF0104 family)
VFRLFFDRLESRQARALAWTSQGSGALLPGGGVGGYAIGGCLARFIGQPTSWIIQRSSGLFFLTSGVNATAVIDAGLLLADGAGGPHDFLRAGVPLLLASAATLVVLGLPALTRRHRARRPWLENVVAGIRDAQRAVAHPTWRLVGALGYLGFDIAGLWVTLAATGQPLSVPAITLAYSVGYLSKALPIPGGIGVLDAGLTGALVLYGSSPIHAAAAVLVFHSITLWSRDSGGCSATCAYALVRSTAVPDRRVAGSAARL